MVKWFLIVLFLACIFTTTLWFTSSEAKKIIQDLGPLVTIIPCILTLTVFLQFYNEIKKAKEESKEKSQLEKARLNSRMVALGSEIINNIQLCNLFEAEKEKNLLGLEVPNMLFEYSVASSMIINGDITYHKLRSELTSIMLQMKSINNLLNFQMQLMIFKNFASLDRQEYLKMRTIQSMSLLHSKLPLIKQQLINTEPLFNELWENPEKYIDEHYLKDKMLVDALIR